MAEQLRHESTEFASIVIPLFNESAVIRNLTEALRTALVSEPGYSWEIVFIDDGSTDGTMNDVRECCGRLPATVRVIRLSRNFGHQPALMAGISAARGNAVICMDADLQDPPSLISPFLRHYEQAYDVVYAVRMRRDSTLLKKAAYHLFYRLLRRVSDVPIPLDAGDFGLLSRRAAAMLLAMPERDLFLRGLRSWIGFRQVGIPYSRPDRFAGETKYSYRKLLKLAASAFFGFSLLPLRIATSLGLTAVFVSVCYALFAVVAALLQWSIPRGWASVIVVISFIGGAQLVSIGILGEYIGRIYKQTQGRPLYIVAEEMEISPGG
jgi:glycosyltransferase involved in cell wall biosynthesis